MRRRGAKSVPSRKKRQRRENNQQRLNGIKHNLYNRRPGPKKDLSDRKSAMSNRYTDDKSRWQSNRNDGVPIHDGNFGRKSEPKVVCDMEFYNSGYQSTHLHDASRETHARTQTNYSRKAHSRLPNASDAAPDNSKSEHHMNGSWTDSSTTYPIKTVNSSSNRLSSNQFCNNSHLVPPKNRPNHILNRGLSQPGYNGSAQAAYLHPSQPANRRDTYPNGTPIDPRMRHSPALHNASATPNLSGCVANSAVQSEKNSANSEKGGPINYMTATPQEISMPNQKLSKPHPILPSPLRPGAKLLNNGLADVSTAIAKSLMQMDNEVTKKCVPDLQEGDTIKSTVAKPAPNRNKYDSIKGIKIRNKSAGSKSTQDNDSSTPIGILTKSQNEAELDKVPNDSAVEAQPSLLPESSTLLNKQNNKKSPQSGTMLSGEADKVLPVAKCVESLSLETNKKTVKGAHLNKNVKAGKLDNLTAYKKSVKNSIQESNKKVTEQFTHGTANKLVKNSVKMSNKEGKEGSPQKEVAGTKKTKTVAVVKPGKDSKELISRIVKKPSKNVRAKVLDKNSPEKRSGKKESNKKINEKSPDNLVNKNRDKNGASKKVVNNFPAGLNKKSCKNFCEAVGTKSSQNALVKTKYSKNCSDSKSKEIHAIANVGPKGNASVLAEKRTAIKKLPKKLNGKGIGRSTGSMEAKRPNKSATVKNVKKLSTKVPVKKVLKDRSGVTSIEPVQVENPQDSDFYSSPEPEIAEESSITENCASKSENDSKNNTVEKSSSIYQNVVSPIESLTSWLQSSRDSEEVTELPSAGDAEEVTEWSYHAKSSSVENNSTSQNPDLNISAVSLTSSLTSGLSSGSDAEETTDLSNPLKSCLKSSIPPNPDTNPSSNALTSTQSSLTSGVSSGAEESTELPSQVKSCLKKSSSVTNNSNSVDSDTSCSHQPTPATNHVPTPSSTPPVTPGTLDNLLRNLLGQPQIIIPDDDDDNSSEGRSNLNIIPKLNPRSTRNRNGKEGRNSTDVIVLRDSPSPPLMEPDSQAEPQPIVIIDDSSSDDDVILVEDDVGDNTDNGLDDDLDEEQLLKDDYDLSSIGSDRIDDILVDDLDGEEGMKCNDVVKNFESQSDQLKMTSETSQNSSDLRPKCDLVSFARSLKRRSSSSDQSPSCSSTTPDLSAEKMDSTPNSVESTQVGISSTEVPTCSKLGKSSTGIENEAESTITNEMEANNIDKMEKITGGILHGWYYDDDDEEEDDDEEIVSSSSTVDNPLTEPDSSNSETPNLVPVQNNLDSEAHTSTSVQSPSAEKDSLVRKTNLNSEIPNSPEIKEEPDFVQVSPDSEAIKSTSIQSPSSKTGSLEGQVDSKSEVLKSLEIKDEPGHLKIGSPLVGNNSDTEAHSPVIQSNSVSSTDSSVIGDNLDDTKHPVIERNSESVTIKSPLIGQNTDCGKHDLPAKQDNCDFQSNTLPEVNEELTSKTSSLPAIPNNSNQAVNLSVVEEVKTHSCENENVKKGEEVVDVSTPSGIKQASVPMPLLVTEQFDQLVSEFEKFENETKIPEKDDTPVSNDDQALGGSLIVSLTNTLSSTITPRVAENDEAKEVPQRAINCADVSWVDPLAPCERICVMMGKPRNSSDDVDMEIKSELVSEVIVQSPTKTFSSNEASGMSIDPSCKTEPLARSVSFDDSRIIQKNVRKRRSVSDGEGLDSNTEGECTRVKLPRMVSEARSVSLDQPTSSNSEVNASNSITKLADLVYKRTPCSFNQMNNVTSDLKLPNDPKHPTTNCRRLSDGIGENCTEQTAADPTVVNNQIVTTRKISTSLQASEGQGFNTSLADYFDGDDNQTDDMSELQILSYTSLTTNKKVVIANSNPIPQSQPEEKDDDDEVEIVSFTAPTICLFCNNRLKRKKACECDLSNKYIKSEPADSVGSEAPNPTNAEQTAIPIKVERRESQISFPHTISSHPTGSYPEVPAVASVSTQRVQQLQATSQRPLVIGASSNPAVNQQTSNNQITTSNISALVYQTGNITVQKTLSPNNNPCATSAVTPILSSQPQTVSSIPYQQGVPSTTPLASTLTIQQLQQQRSVPNYPPPPYHYPQTASKLTGKQQVSPSTVINYFPANSNIINGNVRVTTSGHTQSVGGATNQCQSAVTGSNTTTTQQQPITNQISSHYQPNQFLNNVSSSARFVGNQVTASANHQSHSHAGSRDNLASIGLNTTASFNRQTSVDSQSNNIAQQNYVVASSQQTISSYQNPRTGAGQPHSSKLPQARQTFTSLLQKSQSSNSSTSAQLQQQQQLLVQQNSQQQQQLQRQPLQHQQQMLQQNLQQQQHLQQQQLQKVHHQQQLQNRALQPWQIQQLQQWHLQQQQQQRQQHRQLQQQSSNVQASSSVSSANAPVPNATGFYQSLNQPTNLASNFSCNAGATTGVGTNNSITTCTSTSTSEQHVRTRTSTSGITSSPDSELSTKLRTNTTIPQTQTIPTTQISSQYPNNQQGYDCASKRLRTFINTTNIQSSNQTQQQIDLTRMTDNRPSSLSSNCSSQSSSPNETNVLLNSQPKSPAQEPNFGFGMIDIRMLAPVVFVKLATITNSPESCYCRRHVPYCMLLRHSITNGAVDIPVRQPLIRCKEIIELLQCKPEALYKSVTFAKVKSLCRIPYFSAVIDGCNTQPSNINPDAEAFLTCCISLIDFIKLIFPKFCHDRYGALGNQPKKFVKMTSTRPMQLDEVSKVQKFQRVFILHNRKFKLEDQTLMVYPPDQPPLPSVLPV